MPFYNLRLHKNAQKVDFGIQKVPFPGFSTKILLLKHGFPLKRFFSWPKNSIKGGVPVYEYMNFNTFFWAREKPC